MASCLGQETTGRAVTRVDSLPEGESVFQGEEVAIKVLYLATTGVGDPTRASLPLHIAANGSVEAEQGCVVVLAGDATELVSHGRPHASRASVSSSARSLSEAPR